MKKIIYYFFFIVLFALSVYPLMSPDTFEISKDGDFYEVNTWEVGLYNVNSSSNWVYDNGSFLFNVIDKTDDDLLGWGFIHQGQQPHSWGLYAFEPPINEIYINPNDDFSLILNIKLKRSNIEWLNGSIPNWLRNLGHKAHAQIGLALFFEVEDKNYSAPTNVYDTNFQFEVTFLRCRLTDDDQVIYLGNDLRFRTPEYDNDTHNLFSLKQIGSNVWVNYKIDLAPYLKKAWHFCKGLFPKTEKIKLKWINFYIEVLNAKLEVNVDSINLVYKEKIYSNTFMTKILTLMFTFLIAVIIIYRIIS